MARNKKARNLKENDLVDVMGREYVVDEIEIENPDITIYLHPVIANGPIGISINCFIDTPVEVK